MSPLPAACHALDTAADRLPAGPVHLAVGMFDGVHLGHLAVLEAAIASARQTGGMAAALTFDPHPSRLLHPDRAVPLLQSLPAKAERMLTAGVDAVLTQEFTADFAALEAEEFLTHLQGQLPGLHSIYVGENWRFGRGRRGDIALLNTLGQQAGLHVFSAPRVNLDGEPISSTRIRTALTAGEMDSVNALLGYTYRSHGTVIPGRQLGRSIGFPTLNLAWNPECAPRHGVYAVQVIRVGESETFPAVANYGQRPTVAEVDAEPLLEIHVLAETCPYTTGDALQIDWPHFLRPEQKFENVESLREQIAKDREAALAWFARG